MIVVRSRYILHYLFLLLSLINESYQAYPKEHLKSLSNSQLDGVINVESAEFDEVFSGIKDYNLVVLFTSLKIDVGCQVCHTIDPVFRAVSKYYNQNYPNSEDTFFISADFGDNHQNFIDMGLNNVPHIWLYPRSSQLYDLSNAKILENGRYILETRDDDEEEEQPVTVQANRYPLPPKIGPSSEHYTYQAPDKLVQTNDLEALEFHMATFVGQLTNMTIVINRPLETKTLIQYSIAIVALFFIIRKRKTQILQSFTGKRFWMIMCIGLTMTNISGLNFSLQKQVQFIATLQGKTGLVFVSPDTRNQLGAEIVLTVGFNIIISELIILLIESVPKIKDNIELRSTATLALGVLLLVTYNVFGNVYLIKDRDYPFVLRDIPSISHHAL